jgi:hypothetical protein
MESFFAKAGDVFRSEPTTRPGALALLHFLGGRSGERVRCLAPGGSGRYSSRCRNNRAGGVIAAKPLVKITAGNRNDRRRSHPSHYGRGCGAARHIEALAPRLPLWATLWEDGRPRPRVHGKRHSPNHRGPAGSAVLIEPRPAKSPSWTIREASIRVRLNDQTAGTPDKKEAANAIEKGAVGPERRSPFREVCCSKSVAFARRASLSFNVLDLPPNAPLCAASRHPVPLGSRNVPRSRAHGRVIARRVVMMGERQGKTKGRK